MDMVGFEPTTSAMYVESDDPREGHHHISQIPPGPNLLPIERSATYWNGFAKPCIYVETFAEKLNNRIIF